MTVIQTAVVAKPLTHMVLKLVVKKKKEKKKKALFTYLLVVFHFIVHYVWGRLFHL